MSKSVSPKSTASIKNHAFISRKSSKKKYSSINTTEFKNDDLISREIKIFKFHCPMAFNGKGSDWLQNTDKLENPYLGQSMLKCGNQIK